MSFPIGWTHRFGIVIDRTKVVGTPTGFVLLVTKDMLPASVIDAGGISAQDGGGDLRFSADAAGANRLPMEVVDFHPDAVAGNRRCEVWVNMAGFEPSSSVDTIVYGWCRAPVTMQQPAPWAPFGAERVWSSLDYKTVHHGNAGAFPEATGLWLIRPAALEYNGAIYRTWIDYSAGGTGKIKVAKYVMSTGVWTPAVTVDDAGGLDAHCAPTLGVTAAGNLLIGYANFANTTTQLKVARSNVAENIGAWTINSVSTGVAERTYPRLLRMSTGTLVLISREDDVWVRRVSTDNGTSWGTAVAMSSGLYRKYYDFYFGANDRLHAISAVTGSGGQPICLNIYYWYCDDITSATPTLKAVDGTTIGATLNPAAATTVSTGRVFETIGQAAGGWDRAYPVGVTANGSNWPLLTAQITDDTDFSRNRNVVFRFDGTAWQRADVIVGTQSRINDGGGLLFIGGTTWRMLCNQLISGVLEIVEYQSLDDGVTWSLFSNVTQGSTTDQTQPQYVSLATGGITSTHLSCNGINPVSIYNATHDICLTGASTDDIAWFPMDIKAPGNLLRDSTKYRNQGSPYSNPTLGSSAATVPWGRGIGFNGGNGVQLGNKAAVIADLATSLQVQWWMKFNGSGSFEKIGHRGSSTGSPLQWLSYRQNDQKIWFGVGNGSTNNSILSATTVAAGVPLHWVGKFYGTTIEGKLNADAPVTGSYTGPLWTGGSTQPQIGETINGSVDEFRMLATIVSDNTLDTEYANQSNPATFATATDFITLSAVVTLEDSGVVASFTPTSAVITISTTLDDSAVAASFSVSDLTTLTLSLTLDDSQVDASFAPTARVTINTVLDDSEVNAVLTVPPTVDLNVDVSLDDVTVVAAFLIDVAVPSPLCSARVLVVPPDAGQALMEIRAPQVGWIKDVDEVLDYGADFTQVMSQLEADSIGIVSVSANLDLEVVSNVQRGNIVAAMVSGGTPGRISTLTIRVTTQKGRVIEVPLYIQVVTK